MVGLLEHKIDHLNIKLNITINSQDKENNAFMHNLDDIDLKFTKINKKIKELEFYL